MVWRIIPVDAPGNEFNYAADDIKKINKYLSGYNLKIDDVTDEVDIDTDTSFSSEKLSVKSPTTGFKYIFKGSAITADRIVTLPLMTGDGTIALTAAGTQANDWGDFMQTFRNQNIQFRNPANTFSYIWNTGAITANRSISLPVLTGNDTVVFAAATQTLTNKTLTSPTISAMTINTDSNTIKHSTTNNAGDLLVNTGSKFDRLARGTADQVPIMNPTGTGLTWIDKASLTGSGGGGGGTVTGDYLVPTTVGNICTGAWYGTSVTAGSGIFSDFLTDTGNTFPSNITDSTGRMGMRWDFSSDDDRGGFRTNNVFVTRMNNPELIVRYKYTSQGASHTSSTSYRVVIGFTSDPFADYGADGAIEGKHFFGWFKETADSSIGIGGNNGTTTATKNTTVSLSQTNESIHTIRLFADDTNARWGVSLDGANATTFNFTDLPSQTARLGVIVQFENEGTDDRTFEIYGATFRAKVI